MDMLIDTNVVLDVLQSREPFREDSKKILALCIQTRLNGFMTAHSLCDIFYILRKDLSVAERLSLIDRLCKYMTIISEHQADFESVSKNPLTKDLEDGLQMESAKNHSLKYIVTRNVKDFENSTVPALNTVKFFGEGLILGGTTKCQT